MARLNTARLIPRRGARFPLSLKPTIWLRGDKGLPGVADTGAVTTWADQSGNGNDPTQGTAGSRPTLALASVGGKSAVLFDGVDDYLRIAAATLTSTAAGSLGIVFKTSATAFSARQVLLSAADEAATNVWFEVGISADGRIYIDSNAAGTQHTVMGPTYLELSTAYSLTIAWDDTDYYVVLSSFEENPLVVESIGTAGWFGDVAGADNLVVGGTVTSAGIVRPFKGWIAELWATPTDITA